MRTTFERGAEQLAIKVLQRVKEREYGKVMRAKQSKD